MAKPILVLLAAGMGSRYGGLKQMDSMGDAGETLLDYSVYDAIKAGFGKIVFIIRRDFEKAFRETVLSRMEGKVNYELAFQEPDKFIPNDIMENAKKIGRIKPWGTAHALLCAKPALDAPFAVINADDFYSRASFEVLGKYLSAPDVTEGAIVPYKLEKTLSAKGSVTRGVCAVKDGYLRGVDELRELEKSAADGKIYNTWPDGNKKSFAPDTPVSMNCWGFPLSIMEAFQVYFDDFLAASGRELKSECFIPLACDHFIKTGKLAFKTLDANSDWFGVTYKDDAETARKHLARLTASGVYPKGLWG
jgi:hypothetical protein